ncbi:MAG: hypothetical protein ABR578_10060 [Chromatocurvus sp.]
MMTQAQTQTTSSLRQSIKCPTCTAMVFDGLVIKSRVVRVLAAGAEAKCRCKTWVPVPVTYSG